LVFGISAEAAAFALALMATPAVYVMTILDMLGLTPNAARPTGNASGLTRLILGFLCAIGVVASGVALVLFAQYGAIILGQALGTTDDTIAAAQQDAIRWLFFPLYEVLVVGAAALVF